LLGAARMRYGSAARVADLLGIFPQIARGEIRRPHLPAGAARVELGLVELDVERALVGVDVDDVAVADERNRAADGRLGPDMADAEAARCAGKPSVRNGADLAAHALAVQGRSGGQHFPHARPAFGALVADHQHVAFPVLTRLDGFETRFFVVETPSRTGEPEVLQAGDLYDRAL